MKGIKLQLKKIQLLNIRGFSNTMISIDRGITAIIGNNNEGKSSLLEILSFVFNIDDKLIESERQLSDEEKALLIPANSKQYKASRITLYLDFNDGRTKRKYVMGGEKDVLLRINILKSSGKIRINYGKPRRNEKNDVKAIELLNFFKNNILFCLIPAVRDITSPWFAENFRNHISQLFQTSMVHAKQAGAPSPYRESIDLRKKLKEFAEKVTLPFWDGLANTLPKGFIRQGKIRFKEDYTVLIEWLSSQETIQLITGKHDEKGIIPTNVGHGLQSLISLSLGLMRNIHVKDKQKIIAIEEPEAFLHPNAQRRIMNVFRGNIIDNTSIIITSHSPVIVEELKYGETVIVRDFHFYEPLKVDSKRAAISSDKMCVSTAEIFFSDMVLFVEGPGDKAFFNTIFRRLSQLPKGDLFERICVQEVGGNRSFSPWIKLLRCYGTTNDRPIKWLCLMDSDSSSGKYGDGAVLECLRNVYTRDAINAEVQNKLEKLGNTEWNEKNKRKLYAKRLNKKLWKFRAQIFSCDLEWALVNSKKNNAIKKILNQLIQEHNEQYPSTVSSYNTADIVSIAKKLGSKIDDGKKYSKHLKSPYLRMNFAKQVPFAEISEEMKSILEKVVKRAFPSFNFRRIWNQAIQQNPKIL